MVNSYVVAEGLSRFVVTLKWCREVEHKCCIKSTPRCSESTLSTLRKANVSQAKTELISLT